MPNKDYSLITSAFCSPLLSFALLLFRFEVDMKYDSVKESMRDIIPREIYRDERTKTY